MDDVVDRPRPGPLLRLASTLSPGVRSIESQIEQFHRYWLDHNSQTLADLDEHDLLVVALGDSLSQGIGVSEFSAHWLLGLAASTSPADRTIRVVNLAVSGARTADVLSGQMDRLDALGCEPDLVTCTTGSNDLFKSAALWRTLAQMDDLVERLGALGCASVVATVPAAASLAARLLNRRIRLAAGSSPTMVADVATHFDWARRHLAPDRFHPNDLGYEAWHRAFEPAFASLSQ
jgi:lysophospholipase L1-like esterase